ncbi:AAA family ATPase [Portibacter marinus]|uniref:AAA family ATPase n=1 Tax=Portibacter marinus TaxID=2898660 RepID=UPI001F41705E|nr:AAA family ATPase [Portibacter marinus]
MIKSLRIEKFRLFENQDFKFGKYITAISGQNAVGKSTLLGLIGNIVELRKKNIFGKQFRTDFSEIFKASPEFDKTGEHKGTFYLVDIIEPTKDYEVSFRSTWQDKNTRFRVIPDRKDEDGNKVASKYPFPVIYLGLSRLYPIGETKNKLEKDDLRLSVTEKEWFARIYKSIFSMADSIEDITNHKTKEVKSNFTGITTENYDAFCNSAGQDNLGQILLSLISFKRLKNEGFDWKGGILIIDEFDAALHPVAQQKLVDFLFKEAKSNQLQIIFTTHSLTTLEFVSKKYELNKKFSDDYKLIFISNANNKIKVYQNPAYELIKNNLCLTITQKSKQNNKLLVYSEDDDTRWFFKKLIHGYANKLNFVNANLGCSSLAKLLKEDPNYFSKVLIVVDGDVKKSNPRFTAKKNVLALVDEISPENVLFTYLNDENCTFWDAEGLEQQGMTRQYFLTENGPFSPRYSHLNTDRKKFSSWFYDHKRDIIDYKMFEHWKKNNPDKVKKFRSEFFSKYNYLASKNDFLKLEIK